MVERYAVNCKICKELLGFNSRSNDVAICPNCAEKQQKMRMGLI